MVKNLILWVVVAVVMMTAYQSFNSTSTGSVTDYTTFITDVENSQVRQAKFEDNEILVTKADGAKYTTGKKRIIISNLDCLVPDVVINRRLGFLHASNARWWR